MGALCSKCSFMISPGHNTVKGLSPDRTPPNPTHFPNYMQNRKGLWLYWREWWPRGRSVEGVVFFVGGFGEHGARYDSHAARFNAKGYVCFFLDHQGHGLSEGVRKYAEAFQDFLEDYKQFIDARLAMPLVPDYAVSSSSGGDFSSTSSRQLVGDLQNRFIFGHSLGGLMTIRLCMQHPSLFKGAVISAPALEVDPELATPFLRKVAKFLANTIPKWQLDKLEAEKCSRNPQVILQMKNDYLMSPESAVRARTGNEILLAQDDTFANLDKVTFPFFLLHGKVDKVCRIDGSQKFYERTRANYVNSNNGRNIFKEYDGVYHESFSDLEKGEQIYRDVFAFISSMESSATSTSTPQTENQPKFDYGATTSGAE